MRLILVIILGIFICSCEKIEEYQISEKEKLANKIIGKVANKLAHEKDLIPCGTGAQMMYEIKMLGIAFEYRRLVNLNEGRELLVSAVQEFLTEINSNEQIRPYLNNYPFEPKNIEIIVYLRNPDGSGVAPKELHIIAANEGILQYNIDDLKGNLPGLLKTIHEETFEEALQEIERTATPSKASDAQS